METGHHKGVTVIGLGPMGQAMAGTFLKQGYEVTVWNRTLSKADELAAQGALKALTVEEALAANPLAILSLTDYDAMYAILESAQGSLHGKVIVNLSSDTPAKARQAAAWLAGYGAVLLMRRRAGSAFRNRQPGLICLLQRPNKRFRGS